MRLKPTLYCVCLFISFCADVYSQKLTLPGGKQMLTQGQRVAAAKRAGDYLTRTIKDDGLFIYSYSPRAGKAGNGYNWLRHCGTVMSLCQLYQKTGEKTYLEAAERAIPPFMKRIRTVNIGGKPYKALVSNGRKNGEDYESVKTGGCALAAIALMTYDSCKGTSTHKDTVLGLCAYIRKTQMRNGLLRSKYILKANPKESYYSDFQSLFYQGEALLALAMAQDPKRYPTEENQKCMLRLLNYLAFEWSAALDRPQKVIFDHWGMIGLSRTYGLVNDDEMKKLQEEYLKMTATTVEKLQRELKTDLPEFDRIAKGQRLIANEALRSVIAKGPMTSDKLLALGFDYCENELLGLIRSSGHRNLGSFTRDPGRVCPAATRIEGISAFGGLVLSIPNCEYAPRVQEWMERVDLARRFMVKCQYTPADQKKVKGPVNIAGGIRDNLSVKTGDVIRIDYCQHTISALLGW